MLADMVADGFEFSWIFAQIGRFRLQPEVAKKCADPSLSAAELQNVELAYSSFLGNDLAPEIVQHIASIMRNLSLPLVQFQR